MTGTRRRAGSMPAAVFCQRQKGSSGWRVFMVTLVFLPKNSAALVVKAKAAAVRLYWGSANMVGYRERISSFAASPVGAGGRLRCVTFEG
jgi:hypothetical protein